jgi:hypothetical protein
MQQKNQYTLALSSTHRHRDSEIEDHRLKVVGKMHLCHKGWNNTLQDPEVDSTILLKPLQFESRVQVTAPSPHVPLA